MVLESLYILWGGITAVALGCSTAELIDRKKKENDKSSYYYDHPSTSTKTILALSLLSAIVFVIVGVVFMTLFLSFVYEKPKLSEIISILAVWPGFSFVLGAIGVQIKLDSISKHKKSTISTVLIALAIISIVLYYCYFGYTLSNAFAQI